MVKFLSNKRDIEGYMENIFTAPPVLESAETEKILSPDLYA
jgi:hypothetical protein